MEELTLQQRLWKGMWAVLSSLKTVLLYMVLPALFMCVGMIFKGRSTEEVVAQSSNFYYALGIIFSIFILHRISKKKGSTLFQEATLEYRGLSRSKLIYLAVAGFGLSFMFSSLITVLPIPEVLMEGYRNSSDGLREGRDQVLALVSTILLAPFAEEIIFRGYMLNRLLESLEVRTSLWIGAAVFALCHISLIWMIYAGIMGYLLGWVSVKEDNIAYSVVFHVGFNASVLPIWLLKQNEVLYQAAFGGTGRILFYGVAAAAAAVWAFKRYLGEDVV